MSVNLINRHNARQRRQSLANIEKSRRLVVDVARNYVKKFISTLNENDLGNLCHLSLEFIVGKLKANKAVMLVNIGNDSLQLFSHIGFHNSELVGVAYVATYTPFYRKLIDGKPFEYSNCSSLLDDLNLASRLFYLDLRYWIPVLSDEDSLIALIGVDTPPKNEAQKITATTWAQKSSLILRNAISHYCSYNSENSEIKTDIMNEKACTSLYMMRRLISMSSNTPQDIVNTATDLLVENMHARKIVVFTSDKDNRFSIVKNIGIEKETLKQTSFTLGDNIFSKMLSYGKLFELSLNGLTPDDIPYELVENGMNYFVPFIKNTQDRKIMGLAAMKLPIAPIRYQILISRFIATVTALSLHNIQLRQELDATKNKHEHQMNKLQMLYDVGRALNVIDNRTELLKKILGHATDIVQAEKGSVMLLNSNYRLEVNVVKGIDEEIANNILHGKIRTTSLALGEGIAGTVAQTGMPVLINDVAGLDKTQKEASSNKNNVKFVTSKTSHVSSILCVPLRAHNEIIGVINITNKKQGKSFTDDDLRIVEQVADQAAVAIHNARLYELAITDSLTKVLVRHQLFMRLENEIRRLNRSRDRKCVSVIMVDIDFFKSINDRFGHPFGDKVLVEVSSIMRNSLRSVDSICRYGGEEFCIILPDTDVSGARQVARRINRMLEKLDLQTDSGTQVRVSVSGGISVCCNYKEVDPQTNNGTPYKIIPNKTTVSDLIKYADAALYYSKQHGRNQFTVFDDVRCISNPNAICSCQNHDLTTCRTYKQKEMICHTTVTSTSIDDSTENSEINSAHGIEYESDMR